MEINDCIYYVGCARDEAKDIGEEYVKLTIESVDTLIKTIRVLESQTLKLRAEIHKMNRAGQNSDNL